MNTPASVSGGTHEGWMQSSTCRAVDEAGRAAGRAYGLAESMARTWAVLLQRQARQRFGNPDATQRATLDGLAQAFACDRLEELAEGLVTAASWNAWLAGVTVPPPAAGLPPYTKNLEIDFERSGPSIDTHFRAAMKGGGRALIHLRMQKWYQPNLDRHLYEESCKLERKFGSMPMVAVFLLWPPADGPDVTGRYEERDSAGNVKRVFTYQIKRAWEMELEEVTHSVGTMMLAPLTRGSKQRMPEIVRRVKKALQRHKADAKTRDALWDAVYWSMGLICDLDECHHALGDMLPVIQQSHYYQSAKGQAFLDEYSAAQRDGPTMAARALVLRQATRRFGAAPGAAQELLASATLERLKGLTQHALTAADWPSLLASAPTVGSEPGHGHQQA
jgi:hypothetical protein